MYRADPHVTFADRSLMAHHPHFSLQRKNIKYNQKCSTSQSILFGFPMLLSVEFRALVAKMLRMATPAISLQTAFQNHLDGLSILMRTSSLSVIGIFAEPVESRTRAGVLCY